MPDTDTIDFEPEVTETEALETGTADQSVTTSRVAKGKSKIAEMIDEKLISAADMLDQASNGFGAAPSSLSAFTSPVRGTLDRAGEKLRNTDGDELVDQARDFIVKRPGAFVIATALVAAAAANALVLAARNDAGPERPAPKRGKAKRDASEEPDLA